MNTFEDLFEIQQKHYIQHLERERNNQLRTTLIDDASCIICYPPPVPSEQALAFRVFLKWARLILGARQYTSKTITEFESANNSRTSELQILYYRRVLYSFVYNKLPTYTFDQVVNLVVHTHRQTRAFNKDPGSTISEYFETPTSSVPSSPSPVILRETTMGKKGSTTETLPVTSTFKPIAPPNPLDTNEDNHSTHNDGGNDHGEYQPDDVITAQVTPSGSKNVGWDDSTFTYGNYGNYRSHIS